MDTLLPNYAWYQANGGVHTWPVAKLKPNDFGLFDMQGNAIEWVYDSFSYLPSSKNTAKTSTSTVISADESRLMRGGSYYSLPGTVGSARRVANPPGSRFNFLVGFRPARTYGVSR